MRIHLSDQSGSSSLIGYRSPLFAGDSGTEQTVRLMRRLIDAALNDPQFVRFAIELVRNVPAHDELSEVAAIYGWVLGQIRFTKDPLTKEKLYPPQELLKIRAGDCDDISMLIAALAMAVGYRAQLVTVSADPGSPDQFSHVYVEVEVPPMSGNWIALDAARPGAQFGLSPQMFFRKRAWSLVDDTYQDLRGLSGYAQVRGSFYRPGLGDDGIDWSTIISQGIQETPQIVAVATGQPSQIKLPGGATTSTGSPYASFATPYTPGYTVPGAGYGLQQVSSSLFSSALPWLALGLVAMFAFRGRR